MNLKVFHDNGGRRTFGDRRAFSYDVYLPERRSGKARRSGSDRRAKRYKENGTEFRGRIE